MSTDASAFLALADAERLAAAADRAWAGGDDRRAAQHRLAVLRALLDLRDRLQVVVERSTDPVGVAAMTAVEGPLLEDLIAGRATAWPLQGRVRALLDAQAALLGSEVSSS